jgi:hypothetical protein
VSIAWDRAPSGKHRVPITINGPNGGQVVVHLPVDNRDHELADQPPSFVESNGYVSMEGEHFSRAVGAPPIRWQRIPGLGRTASAMTTLPVTATSQTPGGESPRLEYRVHLLNGGDVRVRTYLSPTLDFRNEGGLRYAVSFDDQPPQVINMHAGETLQTWEKWVADNINETVSKHTLAQPGFHLLKFWMVDPGVVLQKLVIETRDVKPSYLGPPESKTWPLATAGSR